MAKKEITNDEIMTALSQFADSVDKRFDGIDQRLDAVDKRFNGVDQRFDNVEKHLQKLDANVSRIYDILDTHMARIEKIIEENSVQTHQQERLQRWIFQLADQAGVKLKYE